MIFLKRVSVSELVKSFIHFNKLEDNRSRDGFKIWYNNWHNLVSAKVQHAHRIKFIVNLGFPSGHKLVHHFSLGMRHAIKVVSSITCRSCAWIFTQGAVSCSCTRVAQQVIWSDIVLTDARPTSNIPAWSYPLSKTGFVYVYLPAKAATLRRSAGSNHDCRA